MDACDNDISPMYQSDDDADADGGDIHDHLLHTVSSSSSAHMSATPITMIGRKRNTSSTTSWVWLHYRQRNNRIYCNECAAHSPPCYAISTGTSTLKRHLCVAHRIHRNGKTGHPLQCTLDASGRIINPMALDHETKALMTKSLAEFIVDDKQAFRLVESRSFAPFCKNMNRHYVLPSRQSLVRAVHDAYRHALVEFRRCVAQIPGRVALTLDGCSSRMMNADTSS